VFSARFGVVGIPRAQWHVHRDRQHIGAVVKTALRSIAVMHIPVDNRNALDARRRRGLNGDRQIVEDAIPIAHTARGVMAGRANHRIGARVLAAQNPIERGECGPGGGERRIDRTGVDNRAAAIDSRRPVLFGLDDRIHIGGRVKALDLRAGGVSSLTPGQAVGDRSLLEDRLHVDQFLHGEPRLGRQQRQQHAGGRLAGGRRLQVLLLGHGVLDLGCHRQRPERQHELPYTGHAVLEAQGEPGGLAASESSE